MYFNALSRFEIEEVIHGFSEHSLDDQQGMFFPKPANIAKHINKTNEPAMSVSERAEIGWADVLHKIGSIGPYANFKSDDVQVIAVVKAMGGWTALCNVTDSELTWKKKEFESNYKSLENTPLEHLPKHLSGLIDKSKDKAHGQKALGELLSQVNARSNQKLLGGNDE